MELQGKHFVLGLTGGIACYKSAELVRLLTKAGATVQVVMTDAATHFITPVTMQALSGRPVFTSEWDNRIGNNMAHIELGREVDAILVAPASADFMAKLGGVMACQENGAWVLQHDELLAVFPEGIRGAFSMYDKVYTLGKFGRDEFVRMALRNLERKPWQATFTAFGLARGRFGGVALAALSDDHRLLQHGGHLQRLKKDLSLLDFRLGIGRDLLHKIADRTVKNDAGWPEGPVGVFSCWHGWRFLPMGTRLHAKRWLPNNRAAWRH